jgi:predicted nucleic acid-binding protein
LTYILDACALIAFVNEEKGEGYEAVDALIERAAVRDIKLCISIVNLVEVHYHCIRRDGEEIAGQIVRDVAELPVTVIDTVTDPVSRGASRLKARYPISLGDAFLCAAAANLSAVIVTKDREIEAVEKGESLPVLWIH